MTVRQARRLVAAAVATCALGTGALGTAAALGAGTYQVLQCHAQNRGHEATLNDSLAYSVNAWCDVPANENAIQINSIRNADAGRAGQARWTVPDPGALAIVHAEIQSKLRNDGGHRARVYAADAAGRETARIASGETGPAGEFSSSALSFPASASVVARLFCNDSGGCSASDQAKTWVRSVRLTIADHSNPAFVRLGGSLRAGGWLRGQQGLDVVATDRGSGLAQIVASVNGAALASKPGQCPGRISGTAISSRLTPCGPNGELRINPSTAAPPFQNGANDMRVCITDFAGNLGCDQRTVHVDNAPPSLAFANSEDPADPELIRVAASDPHSGIAAAQIRIRPMEGAGDWKPLSTQAEGGELRTRVDSRAYPPGRYELRAEAADVAGNAAATTSRANGEPMVVNLPLRESVRLDAHVGPGGSKRQSLAYGQDTRAAGRLTDASGDPLAGERVRVEEYFGRGALIDRRVRAVRTDARGRWDSKLPAGPSRQVTVSYEGSRRYLDGEREAGRLAVRSQASFKTSRRSVRAGRAVKFLGRIGRLGARIPSGGKLLELQVREGPGRWNTVREAFRTNAKGRYKLRYRFGTFYSADARFRFRVKVAREQGWPYKAPVRSKARAVVVKAR